MAFNTKSVTSKNPTFRSSWRHSKQSDKLKAAKVTSPTRRQAPVRFNDASHSPRKNPNGTKTIRSEITSLPANSSPMPKQLLPSRPNAPREHGKECRGRIPAKLIRSAQFTTSLACESPKESHLQGRHRARSKPKQGTLPRRRRASSRRGHQAWQNTCQCIPARTPES